MKSKLPFICIAILLALLLARTSYAQNSECLDLEELNQKWPTYYNDIHLTEPIEVLRCGSHQYEIAKALDIIKSVDVPEVGGMYEYVTQSTPQVSIDLREIYGNTMAGATTKKIRKHKVGIELYRNFFGVGDDENAYSVRDIIRASTLVHESRHMYLTDSAIHILCARGQDKGVESCDDRFINDWNNANAYSFEILFLKKLMSNHSSRLSYSDKKVLQLLIKTLMNNAFNE